jgi:hypothetical protein
MSWQRTAHMAPRLARAGLWFALMLGAWLLYAQLVATSVNGAADDQNTQRLSKVRSELRYSSDDISRILDRYLLAPRSLDNARADLQAQVQRAVVANGGEIDRIDAKSNQLVAGISTVSVLLQADFSEAGLLTFLRALETAEPKLFVAEFNVVGAGGAADRPLRITATLTGYISNAP